MRRRGALRFAWRLPATIAALALLVGGCAASRVPASAPRTLPPIPAARAKIFVPVSTSVARTEHGSCWTTSITVRSTSAYRCYAHNQILDPCFASGTTAHDVVCYADPWSLGIRLVLSAKLPKQALLAVSHPWALELGNGKRCVAATGVVDRIGNLPLLYQCRGGGAAGLPVTKAGHTDVQYVAPGSSAAIRVPVTVSWQA